MIAVLSQFDFLKSIFCRFWSVVLDAPVSLSSSKDACLFSPRGFSFPVTLPIFLLDTLGRGSVPVGESIE